MFSFVKKSKNYSLGNTTWSTITKYIKNYLNFKFSTDHLFRRSILIIISGYIGMKSNLNAQFITEHTLSF